MELFGKTDASLVPDDPFKIAPNTYWATCVNSVGSRKDDGSVSVKLTWQINEPESDYDGKKVDHYFNFYPEKVWVDDGSGAEVLTGKEKTSLTFTKRSLREGFNLSEAEMQTVTPQFFLEKRAFITTFVNDAGFNNIKRIVSKEKFDEENEVPADLASAGFQI